MASRSPHHRYRGWPSDHCAYEGPTRHNLGYGTTHLPSASLDDHSRISNWILSNRTDYAISLACAKRTFKRRDHSLVSRTSGRHRYETVLVEATRCDHYGWRGWQCGARRAEHLRGWRDRIVAVG